MAEAALEETEKALNAAIARLREVEEGVEKLRKLLQEEEDKKAKLEREKQLCEDRMARAVRLIDGLAGEQIRWTATVAEFQTCVQNAVGDILLASGTNFTILAKCISLRSIELTRQRTSNILFSFFLFFFCVTGFKYIIF